LQHFYLLPILLLITYFYVSGADSSRIIGGRDAAPHSLPYMASVQLQGRHLCGGALVREDFVLTAAHCETRGYGDSGGPLVCDGDAAGVISFSGRRCGDPQTPDVYTRISSFRAWIQRVLNDN
uniref:Mast cell protease 1A n=1 Tax=Oreochromis niloticus TaxID=8128 RepID=A0A669DR89_ORENI